MHGRVLQHKQTSEEERDECSGGAYGYEDIGLVVGFPRPAGELMSHKYETLNTPKHTHTIKNMSEGCNIWRNG